MSISKLNFNSISLIDLTDTSVDSSTLYQTYTAHSSIGNPVLGAAASNFPVENALVDGSFSGSYINNRIGTVGYMGAFRYLTHLTSVNLPNITTLQGFEFDGCTALTSVSLPSLTNITSAGYNFRGTAITSFAWPSNIKTVPTYCFAQCASLSVFNGPEITALQSNAFINCTALASVNFPELLTLSTHALRNCTSLTSLNLPKATFLDACSLQGESNLRSLNVPLVTKVGNYGLGELTSLKVMFLPKVTSIGTYLITSGYDGQTVVLPLLSGTTTADSFRYGKTRYVDFGVNVSSLGARTFYQGTTRNVILRRTASIVSAANTNSFGIGTGTPTNTLACYQAVFYVPAALISSYETASNWSSAKETLGFTFTSIEGSPFENYYANGTPITTANPIDYMLSERTTSSSGVTLSITQPNHVKITLSSATSPVVINLTTGEISSSTDIVDNKSSLFEIPAETESKLWLYNIKNTAASTFAINFRLANSTSSASFGTGDGAHTGALTITKTLDTTENVSCLFMYIATPVNGTIEFDVAFGVGGNRYI